MAGHNNPGATPCLRATRATGLVRVSATIASFSSSGQRRPISATKMRFSSIVPDIGTAKALNLTKSVTQNGYSQHHSPPRKAVLRAGVRITETMNFTGEPSPRAPKSSSMNPPFPPAAETWARTEVESML